MYIREVVKRNKGYDKKFVYHRLMESVRTPKGPRQRVVLNLGKLDLTRESWKTLANRIEEIVSGQISFCSPPSQVEELAQHFAGILVKKMMDSRKVLEERVSQTKDGIEGSAEVSCPELQGEKEQTSSETHWEEADLNSMTHSRSRTVGGEALGHYAFGQLQFSQMLKKMGFSET